MNKQEISDIEKVNGQKPDPAFNRYAKVKSPLRLEEKEKKLQQLGWSLEFHGYDHPSSGSTTTSTGANGSD